MINFERCYDRSDEDLQRFLIFCICVAGKNAKAVDANVCRFLAPCARMNKTPFDYLRHMIETRTLWPMMMDARLGKYRVLKRTFRYLAELADDLDLRSCAVEELELVPGIGPKTARFFLLYTRKDFKGAALDTHVLQHLAACGFEKVPKQTPQSPKVYRKWEQVVLELAEREGVDPAEYDNQIWKSRSPSAELGVSP